MKKSFGIPLWLLSIGLASAVIFSGFVVAEISFQSTLDYGQMKKEEVKDMTLATLNQSVDPYNLNFSMNCTGQDKLVYAKLKYMSDEVAQTKNLALDGLTPIDQLMDAGMINLSVKGNTQGFWNCSLGIIASNYTLVNFTV